MKKSREFYDVFDECLDRMAKGEDIEACLKDYPQYARELKPLLETAFTVKQSVSVTPRPEFTTRAKAEFQVAVREANARPRHRFFIWQPVWATAMGIFLAVLLAGSFTVAAAGNSMPDEPLYPVKLATEQVRLVLTPSPVAKAELSAELADRRVNEIINMAAKGEPEKVEVAAARLQQDLDRIASISSAQKQETVKATLAPAVAQPAERARSVPVPSPAPAPVPAPAPTTKPTSAPAPTPGQPDLKAPAESGKMFTASAPTPTPVPTPVPSPAPAHTTKQAPPKVAASSRDTAPAGVKAQDASERLKQSIERYAEKHPEELREALKKAQKESVKSALRKAIAISEDGYRQARKSLD